MPEDDYQYHLITVVPIFQSFGGYNPMPIVMLHEELLIPASRAAAVLISKSFYFTEDPEIPIWLLRLRLTGDDDNWEPNKNRWAGYGWKVLDHKKFEHSTIETIVRLLVDGIGDDNK